MATIGKNILENLTTGMYSDSKVMFREYIQNACDQIDKAIDENILNEKDALIDIYIDYDKRNIIIKDNATGAKAQTFRSDLGDIANSNKIRGEDKGFRGIGRLCGLAYCDTLVFRTSYLDESIGSIMTCDAKKMREMLTSNIKYTIDEIWDTIVSYDTFVENPTEHYFEVKLCNIGKAHEKLLDESEIVGYLNFVAPVPYKNTFILRDQIYGFAQTHKCRIDEYCIKVNGKQIFKDYTTRLKEIAGSGVKN